MSPAPRPTAASKTSSRPTSAPPERVLVIKLGALGDFVLALAAMQRIRTAHPHAHITLLTTPPFEALARACPYVDAVETDGRPRGLGGTLALRGRIRRAKYRRVYDLQTSSRTDALYRLLGPGRRPEWSGTAKGARLRHRNPRRDAMHTLERQADQLREAGVWPDAPVEAGSAPPPDVSWILKRPRGVGRQAAALPEPRPFVLLVPGGSEHRPEKRWPADRFGELAAILRRQGLDVVIVGGPQETALAHAIQRKSSAARDQTGRTDFAQLAQLGARAALAVGNDTGPMHLLAAAGAPVVTLFSRASDPALCGPRGHVAVIQTADLADLPTAQVAQTCLSMLGLGRPQA